MSDTALDAAARELASRRREGRVGPRLPEAARPADVEAALALQDRVVAALGASIAGWKCALPAGERSIVAPLPAGTILRDPVAPFERAGPLAGIEPEVAFVLARDLPARARPYDELEVKAAIGEAHLVLEFLGHRYEDFKALTFPEILADCANNQALYVGPVLATPFAKRLDAFALTIDAGGKRFAERAGAHPDGHPLRGLVWLANHLSQRGRGLAAGAIVTCGSYAGAIDVPVGVPLEFRFGDLGTLAVTLRPAAKPHLAA